MFQSFIYNFKVTIHGSEQLHFKTNAFRINLYAVFGTTNIEKISLPNNISKRKEDFLFIIHDYN